MTLIMLFVAFDIALERVSVMLLIACALLPYSKVSEWQAR